MKKPKFLCSRCKKIEGKEVFMIEKHDMLICPRCKTSLIMTEKSPLPRYEENWRRNAEEVFPLLRPPLHLHGLPNPRLFFLYEDCYHTLLVGRYNASIVLMGVLLEALMKERNWLKLGINLRQAYGACLKKIKDEKLMRIEDIKFLRRFKDEVRNPYQHADESQIVQGIGLVPVWPIEFKGKPTLEKLEKGFKDIKSGRLKPQLMPADSPIIRPIVKQTYDRKHATDLFNQVYDFLLIARARYFKQEEYAEHHKKFGNMARKS